ncbi:MAG TPA: nickel-type superoxide dismutase maturation protease [Streptosporangiaceae bacterium]|jgi:nickel-type superoxide dismutase maturation protease
MRWPLFRVAVAESSMEPTLHPGDWLLVLATGRIRAGQIVVAWHPARTSLLLVKRAERLDPGGWWLQSDSRSGAAQDSRAFGPVPPELIQGRVLCRYRRVRRPARE